MSYKPSVMLKAVTTSVEEYGFWTDPIMPGIWEGMPYQWKIIATVQPMLHSSDETPIPFTYDATSITVGFWITDISGNALQIKEIISSTDSEIEFIVEDVDRYNTFSDPNISGFGGLTSSTIFIFEVSNMNGLPLFNAIPDGEVSYTAIDKIKSRLAAINYILDVITFKDDENTFEIGDLVAIEDGKFVKSANTRFTVGIVNSINVPGGGWFSIKPFGSYSDTVHHTLEGEYGDVFYLDNENPGKVTKVAPEYNAYPVYIRLGDDHTAFVLNTINDEHSEVDSIELTIINGTTEYNIGTSFKSVSNYTVNGISADEFTYDKTTGMFTILPSLGYSVDSEDEVVVFVNR